MYHNITQAADNLEIKILKTIFTLIQHCWIDNVYCWFKMVATMTIKIQVIGSHFVDNVETAFKMTVMWPAPNHPPQYKPEPRET